MPEFEITVAEPNDIDASDLAKIVRLTGAGEAVQVDGLIVERIKRSRLIASAKLGERNCERGAIKVPSEGYIRSIVRKSAYAIPDGTLELGYIATDERFRRRRLAEIICRSPTTRIRKTPVCDDEQLINAKDTSKPRVQRCWSGLAVVAAPTAKTYPSATTDQLGSQMSAGAWKTAIWHLVSRDRVKLLGLLANRL